MPTLREFMYNVSTNMSTFANVYYMAQQNDIQREQEKRLAEESKLRMEVMRNEEARASELYPKTVSQIEQATETSRIAGNTQEQLGELYAIEREGADLNNQAKQRGLDNDIAVSLMSDEVASLLVEYRDVEKQSPDKAQELLGKITSYRNQINMKRGEYGFLTDIGKQTAYTLETVLSIASLGMRLSPGTTGREDIANLLDEIKDSPIAQAASIAIRNGLMDVAEDITTVNDMHNFIRTDIHEELLAYEKDQGIQAPSETMTFSQVDNNGNVIGVGTKTFTPSEIGALTKSYLRLHDEGALRMAAARGIYPGDPLFRFTVLDLMSPQYRENYPLLYPNPGDRETSPTSPISPSLYKR